MFSPEEILDMSCCHVSALKASDDGETIYSNFMGTIENGKICKTCDQDVWNCPGHFGHILLKHPVVNPIFVNDVVNVLRCMCFFCKKFILSKDHYQADAKKHVDIFKLAKNTDACYACDREKPALSVVNETIIDQSTKNPIDAQLIKDILENIDHETARLLGFNPVMTHPKNFVFSVFPIMPLSCRPHVVVEEIGSCDDDLTHQLTEIIKNNHEIPDETMPRRDDASDKAISKLYSKHSVNLIFRISTYFNNSKKKAKYAATARPITGIKERIAGKDGQIRNNLLGKRCDQSGRTVIGPDPTLKLDELIMPLKMAENLTIEEHVNSYNIALLSKLVNSGKANFLIRASDPGRKINLKNYINFCGTLLYYGDVVERRGVKTVIVDTKFKLVEGDRILRHGRYLEKVEYPRTRKVTLELGDVVKRQLMNGDWVILNRQPTLHKVSMMAFKIIVQDIKTLKINLASTKSFNCDFDGDEMNVHVPQSYEATSELRELCSVQKCIMSVQNGKPNMTIVQDSLVGLYLMSKEDWSIATLHRDQFYDLLMVLQMPGGQYATRMSQIKSVLFALGVDHSADSLLNGRCVLSFIFPYDFDYSNGKLKIVDGVFVDGVLNKNVVSVIIKILYKSYGERAVSTFIDNVHFATNKFLVEHGFTISAADCVKNHGDAQRLTESPVNEFSKVMNPYIREQKIMGFLNNRADAAMKKSKDALAQSNNFRIAEESGSKGSMFTICQITSMLGQQTIDGNRVRGLWHQQDDDFKNRGFVEHGFVEGLSPREFMHHAIAGRKGVIDTALLTSVSGYGQRQGVKLNEDIKISSDYTVRDANGRMYRYIFGDVGYDPSQTIAVDGVQTICDIRRYVSRIKKNLRSEFRPLTPSEMNFMVDFIQPRPHIPTDVEEYICSTRKAPILAQLASITVCDSMIEPLKKHLEICYYKTLLSPGECVGILGAQSMGEFSTQATLNTFHVAGSTTTGTVTTCLSRFQEINNASKNAKHTVCKVYFKGDVSTINDARDHGTRLKYVDFEAAVASWSQLTASDATTSRWYSIFERVYGPIKNLSTNHSVVRFELEKSILYTCKITMEYVKTVLEAEHDVTCIFSPLSEGLHFDVVVNSQTVDNVEVYVSTVLFPTYVSGVKGVNNVTYHKDDRLKTWYAQTDGGLLKDFYALDVVDLDNTTTSNVWDVYNTFGVEAAREFRIKEMMEIVGDTGVDASHITLRADRLTFAGIVQSLSRYTMRKENPFSKVGFEEVMENFYKSSKNAETDDLTGVSASIMCGKRPKIGTSMFELKMDMDAVLGTVLPECRRVPEAADDEERFIEYND